MKKSILILFTVAVAALATSHAQDKEKSHAAPAAAPGPMITPSAEGAKTYIVSPKDGDTVKGEFTVVFGLKGMGVAPAGIHLADKPTGHHHLLINTDVTKLIAMNIPLPADDKHVHFGGGQTETTLTLPPGEHTLQLVLGNWTHVPHDPPVYSEVITITVEE